MLIRMVVGLHALLCISACAHCCGEAALLPFCGSAHVCGLGLIVNNSALRELCVALVFRSSLLQCCLSSCCSAVKEGRMEWLQLFQPHRADQMGSFILICHHRTM